MRKISKLGLGCSVFIAAAMIAGTAGAQSGAVYSVNVVGFQKIDAEDYGPGLSMVSTPFFTESDTLDDVIGTQLQAGKTEGSADNVIFWHTSEGYVTYWLDQNTMRWKDLDGNFASNSVTEYLGFFVRNRASSNREVVVTGDVVEDPVVTNTLVPGLNLVSYPYSTSIDINQSALLNGTAGKTEGSADNISLWTTNMKWETYWLDQTSGQWKDLDGVVASGVEVGGGIGFFYRNRDTQNFLWVESRPYTLD